MQARARLISLLALSTAGLVGLAGCSSSMSSTTTPPTPTPTPATNGLTIYPASASVPVVAEAVFTGYVPSQPGAAVTWAVSGSSNGTITTNSSGQGVYTAPASVPSPAQVSITATSGNFSATAVVTVTSAQGVTVSPAAASVSAGTVAQFAANMNGAAATGVTWQVNGTAGGDSVHGTIDANGNYTAPLTPPPGGSTTITAIVGASSGTAAVTVVFSNASLSGDYAFSYTGDDGSGFLGVAGNFSADPASGTLAGTEDVLSAALSPPAVTQVSIAGTYSVGPDGRGSVSIGSTSETWQFALASNQHAVMINFGQIGTTGVATGSGTIDQQTTTGTVLAAGQRYVFQLAGVDASFFPLGVAGSVSSAGNDTFAASPANILDANDAGTATTDDTTLTGVFSLPASSGSPGTLQLTSSALTTITGGTVYFDFYVVNSNHIHLIETSGNALLTGDLFAAPAATGSGYTAGLLQKGNYAFTMGGATQSPYAAGGVFASDGGGTNPTASSGNITGGVFDNNNGGVHFQSDAAISSSGFTVDQTTGRISSSITTPSGTFDWVGYVTAPVDPTNANSVEVLLLETESNVTASGTAYLQSSTAEPNGSFGFNLTGQATGNSAGEQDILAQLGISANGITGTVDFNDFATGKTLEGLNVLSNNSTIAATDANGRGTATFAVADSAPFPVAYYVVDSNTVLMIETDSVRVMTGLMLKQF
jgi:hypothetical protein